MVHEQDHMYLLSFSHLPSFQQGEQGLEVWREEGTKFLLDTFVSCFYGIYVCVRRAGKCEAPFKLYIYPNMSYAYPNMHRFCDV